MHNKIQNYMPFFVAASKCVYDMSKGYVAREVKSQAKLCLYCDKEHYHNNDFCSAKCCKDYRAKKKAEKMP